MEKTKNVMEARSSSRGYALLILLVVVGLALVLYVVQHGGFFRGPKDPDAPDVMPWKEWRMRQESQQALPSDLPGPFSFDLNLRLAGARDHRGEMQLHVQPDGTVWGRWYGNYHKGRELSFDIMGAEFQGSIYPSKRSMDEQGAEPSKQYFLCKGTFLLQETGKQVVKNRAGDIYVRGWLDKDGAVEGRVYITSNEKYYEVFEYKAKSER